MIDVRDLNAVALPDRATVKRLVAEDNADRAQLYAEIAKASNHPEWEATSRRASRGAGWPRAPSPAGTTRGDDGLSEHATPDQIR